MSDYKRLVAYIYLYDKGIKVKNSGFAKIECRNDKLRVNISIKGYFGEQQSNWKVYLLNESRKKLKTILLGDLKCKGQGAEFKYAEDLGNILTVPFDNIKGLAIISKSGQKYATFWQDTDLLVDDIVISDNAGDNRKVSKEHDKKETGDIKGRADTAGMDINKENSANVKIDRKLSETGTAGENNISEDNAASEEKQILAEKAAPGEESQALENEAEQSQEFYKSNKVIEAMSVNSGEEADYCYDDDYNRFVREYSMLLPENLDSQNHTIRVELKDLRVLPKSQWILGNNSFLLHGYYNYHYIILGRIEGKYIVGVPGVFCNREKMVASMFGFRDFKASQVAEQKTGRFGYWFKYI